MTAVLLAVLAATTLTPPLGEATASAVEEGTYIVVTIEVEVDAGFEADYVVVHLLNPDGQETFPLGPSTEGRYSASFTVVPVNRAVLFEIGKADEVVISPTVSLLDLGLDPDLLHTTFGSDSPADDSGRWAWLALAAVALAAGTLLIFFLLPRSKPTLPITDPEGDAAAVVEEE
ncbi:MAG: hypothetical protein ACR2OI_05825 [Acidimicrobiia bacterium]